MRLESSRGPIQPKVPSDSNEFSDTDKDAFAFPSVEQIPGRVYLLGRGVRTEAVRKGGRRSSDKLGVADVLCHGAWPAHSLS